MNCPKCGSEDTIKPTYIAEGEAIRESELLPTQERFITMDEHLAVVITEHLVLECVRCGYAQADNVIEKKNGGTG